MEDSKQPLNTFVDFLSDPESLADSLLWPDDNKDNNNNKNDEVIHNPVLIQTCQYLFHRIEELGKIYAKVEGQNPIVLSGLDDLYVGSSSNIDTNTSTDLFVDADTIWGQVDLQNEALVSLLKKSVKKLSKIATNTTGNNQQQMIRLLDDESSESEVEDKEENESNSDEDNSVVDDDDLSRNDDEEDSDAVSDSSDAKRIQARMDRVMADSDDDDNDDDVSYNSDDASATGGKAVNKSKLSGSSNNSKKMDTNNDDDDSSMDPAAEDLNDGFFSIKEMENFADEEEEYLPDEAYSVPKPETKVVKSKGKKEKTFHQKQRDGDLLDDNESGDDESLIDDDDDDDDDGEFGDLLFRTDNLVRRRKYREDEEIDALLTLYNQPNQHHHNKNDDGEDGMDDVINMTAADVYGKPNKKRFEKWQKKGPLSKESDLKRKQKISWKEDDDDDEHHDSDEMGDWNNEMDGSGDQDGNEENDEEDSDLDEEVPLSSGDTTTKKEEKRKAPTKQVEKIQQQTEQIEKEMLAEKPWQMVGETGSMTRPVNSLLTSTPEFQVVSKLAPIITVEHTTNLEEMIKKRILAEDWDDVIPRELPDVGWHKKKGEAPEVSQEKSKLGLGELYEREYLKKALGYDKDKSEKETVEDKAKDTIKTMFTNLCSKLDALSNYHFTPRPVADETEIRPVTQPAIAMEEILPLHVSNARSVAPEEVYGTKRGRDGILRTDSELDQTDRKRLRRAKKETRRIERKGKLADEKLISRLQPGLGLNNPYEKRKVRDELQQMRAGGKITTGKVDENNTDYRTSQTFFQRLQTEVQQTVRGESQKQNTTKNQSDHEQRRTQSSSYKL